ncbi:MAG: hypothetical protein M3Y21_10430 [Candidatus Eremiobacteraeota bacterium]|nr:hypothetical protein [Candidatus Eremiobacteraeota bacterium]
MRIARGAHPLKSFPLASLGMLANPTIIALNPKEACATPRPLSFATTSSNEHYLVVESAVVGKGCYLEVHVIDLRTLKIVPEKYRPNIVRGSKSEGFDIPIIPIFHVKTTWRVRVITSPGGSKIFTETQTSM